jgi:hypothetical protein
VVLAFVSIPAFFALVVLWSVIVVAIGVPIWAIVDAASHSHAAFHAAGSSKTTWIIVIVAFTILFDVVGFVLSVYYLVVTRPRVRRFDL